MYQTFNVTHFRGFERISFASLSPVNLITGKNDTGKTAVLEALFLLAGRRNPALPNVIEALRGRERFAISAKSVWGWLFHNENLTEPIEISARDQDDGNHSLTMRLIHEAAVTPPLPFEKGTSSASALAPLSTLSYEYTGDRGESKAARAYLEKGEVKFDSPEAVGESAALFLTSRARADKGTAERFTHVDALGRIPDVVKAIQVIDKRIERISLGFEGDQPVLKVGIKGLELMPATHVGEGVSRLLEIVLALVDTQKGLLLIDEVENGIHHSVMAGIWDIIGKMCKEQKVQVVATTHSWECIKSAYEAFAGKDSADLSVHRLDRVDDNGIKVTTYSMADLHTVVETDSDIRGF